MEGKSAKKHFKGNLCAEETRRSESTISPIKTSIRSIAEKEKISIGSSSISRMYSLTTHLKSLLNKWPNSTKTTTKTFFFFTFYRRFKCKQRENSHFPRRNTQRTTWEITFLIASNACIKCQRGCKNVFWREKLCNTINTDFFVKKMRCSFRKTFDMWKNTIWILPIR